jgi:hypothetical protein
MDLGSTTWTNPTEHPVRLKFFLAPGQWQTYEISPKGTASIPNQFSASIHQIRDGVIIGGCAPQLVREGQKEVLHPALMPSASTVAEKPGEKSNRK